MFEDTGVVTTGSGHTLLIVLDTVELATLWFSGIASTVPPLARPPLLTSVPNRVEEDLMAVFPRESWAKLHLQFIYFGREHCQVKHFTMHQDAHRALPFTACREIVSCFAINRPIRLSGQIDDTDRPLNGQNFLGSIQ